MVLSSPDPDLAPLQWVMVIVLLVTVGKLVNISSSASTSRLTQNARFILASGQKSAAILFTAIVAPVPLAAKGSPLLDVFCNAGMLCKELHP